MIVTGASGAVGTEVALQLIKAGVSRLVLFVRDDENVDQRVAQGTANTQVFVQELDLREPQKVVQKFGHSLKNHLEG